MQNLPDSSRGGSLGAGAEARDFIIAVQKSFRGARGGGVASGDSIRGRNQIVFPMIMEWLLNTNLLKVEQSLSIISYMIGIVD